MGCDQVGEHDQFLGQELVAVAACDRRIGAEHLEWVGTPVLVAVVPEVEPVRQAEPVPRPG